MTPDRLPAASGNEGLKARLLSLFHKRSIETIGIEQIDPDILAVTEPYASKIQGIALYISENPQSENLGLGVKRKGEFYTASWALIKDFDNPGRWEIETGRFEHKLHFRKAQTGDAELSYYELGVKNLSEDRKICSLNLNFNLCNQIKTVSLEIGDSSKPKGNIPYELVGIGNIAIGNKGIGKLLDRFVPSLLWELRDNENSKNSIGFNLIAPPNLSISTRFFSKIGFHGWISGGYIIDGTPNETYDIQSTFVYNPESNEFSRRFRSEKDMLGYIRANKEGAGDRRMEAEMSMTRQEYLDALKSILRVLPFNVEDNSGGQNGLTTLYYLQRP